MQIRVQLAIVAVVGVGWAAGNFAVVHPVLAEAPQGERARLAALESQVAREHNNVQAARALSQRYLELDMPRLAVETIGQMDRSVQSDARVSLNIAKAHEMLGEVESASAILNGTLNRCADVPQEFAAGTGCDARTEMELAIELAAVDRMIAWNITPASDPDRAEIAHELALRPITLAGTIR